MKDSKTLKTTTMSLFLFFVILFSVSSDNEMPDTLFPKIKFLNYSDLNYRQLQDDISFFYEAINSGKKIPPLIFYSYNIGDNVNIFSIAAQTGIPYDTIASINRIDNVNGLHRAQTLIIPGQAGIFLPVEATSDLEFIALSWRAQSLASAKKIKLNNDEFYFFPSENYHVIERAFFLNILFCNPLPSGIVSSGYGMRKNPFTDHNRFHNGIDIAAPEGTNVYPAREGEIISIGKNKIFGNYLEIKHSGGYSTFYGHLKKVYVKLNDRVISSMIIAEVGNTGLSTGPHLHFEIKHNGEYRDPSKLLPELNQ